MQISYPSSLYVHSIHMFSHPYIQYDLIIEFLSWLFSKLNFGFDEGTMHIGGHPSSKDGALLGHLYPSILLVRTFATFWKLMFKNMIKHDGLKLLVKLNLRKTPCLFVEWVNLETFNFENWSKMNFLFWVYEFWYNRLEY